jgi:hypothetical protein
MKPRLITLLSICLIALCGCAGHDRPHHRSNGAATSSAPEIPPTDGALAVFRAKVGPVLCDYARNLKGAEQAILKASNDAGGPINASAPESAQTEYAGAMRNLSSVLHLALHRFSSVPAPSNISADYRSFIASLATVSSQADQIARYAAAHNYAEIAAMENTSTPTAGEGVFRAAGITGCQPPTQ